MDKADELRAEAQECREEARDSFERCDTDGFLSQWASRMTAQLKDAQADVAERGGLAYFRGLYHGERRVAAREHWNKWGKRQWLLRNDEAKAFGRRFIPGGDSSRIQRQLGLLERRELAPGVAELQGQGTGLSGCANVHVGYRRTGCPWGTDALPDPQP